MAGAMSEKIHPPTPRRRQMAKEQGRAPRSSDLVSSGLLLATTGLLVGFGDSIATGLVQSLTETLSAPTKLTLDRTEAFWMIAKAVLGIGMLVLPMLITMLMCGIALNLLQTGWILTPEKVAPDLARLSPAKRAAEIFSLRSWGRLGINIMKVIAVVTVSIAVLRTGLPQLMTIVNLSPGGIATTIFELLTRCCTWVGGTLLSFSLIDYALAWWQHERDLMMTDQELREEMRDAQRASSGTSPANSSARTQAITATST